MMNFIPQRNTYQTLDTPTQIDEKETDQLLTTLT